MQSSDVHFYRYAPQVSEQQEKLGRARRTTERLQHKMGIQDADQPQAKELALAEMRDVIRSMMSELATLAAQYPEAAIAERVALAGLKLPAPGPAGTPPGTAGSRNGSRPGSARSGGSAGGASVRSGRSVGSMGGARPGSGMSGQSGLRQAQIGFA